MQISKYTRKCNLLDDFEVVERFHNAKDSKCRIPRTFLAPYAHIERDNQRATQRCERHPSIKRRNESDRSAKEQKTRGICHPARSAFYEKILDIRDIY